ncbi:MAG: lytic transglycosylase domain-containing protein [Roseomonas sp.]|nr:lytic transglycosylase domain-containing protein [Roseomonas sp.]MCA3329340.1 lytic transglycosylase domain-containing protein [Roseomonas sp.]MCA3331416.1 lytic transglycosylase domain-containing protein [Roseomonas sp.]MCA3335495.1 lytic transglycosylase domain-containing protein [Roseomonas sp.]MCA3355685.1 lytic transglycosylase domain-containing protein [Roseomonas sp.]
MPLPALRGPANASLPLAAMDAEQIKQVFALHAARDWAMAEQAMALLTDRRLEGHILADRWLNPSAPRPDQEALRDWLARFADHPDASAIHALLRRAAPRGASLPAAPTQESLAEDAGAAPEEREAPDQGFVRNPALDRALRDLVRDGNLDAALRQIDATRGMTPPYATALKADFALILFRRGEDERAFDLAAEAARSRADPSGRAAFAAGLAAWGLGHFDVAFPYFEVAARASGASAANRAAAAYWASRTAIRARHPGMHVPWLLQAAQEPRTFYGLMARRALGLTPGFAWHAEAGGEEGMAALLETAGGWRALALLQIGQTARAEAELRALWPLARGNLPLLRAMLALASQGGLTHLSAQLAELAQTADGRPRDLARFPLPRLNPPQGFRVEPALLYALARQESNFDPAAVSPAGARGILQVMPTTAAYLANDPSFAGEGAERLHNPGLSLELGQRYLHYLARSEAVGNDLIRLLAAYNAGPGNLAKWLPAARHRGDALLFIEAIPFDETRAHVQRVLAYSWIYASRLGLPAPSLDQLVQGEFPRFMSPQEVVAMLGGAPPLPGRPR